MLDLFIADDHQLFREGLVSLIQSQSDFHVIGQADNGETALDMIKTHTPDVAILDISMPCIDGIRICEMVQQKQIKTKIVMVTMDDDVRTAKRALQAGSHGYLLKDDAFSELIHAVKEVSEHKTFISQKVASQLALSSSEPQSPLTHREKQIVQLIAEGLTNKEIAKKLFISVKTVDTHRFRAMKKLNIHHVVDLVKYAFSHGLVEK
ncbi:response regulator [Algicola sagamiensis]|uniref:response regulator n=1 Tax=Algicola sagamiensis TaxID=163869 RepID=UPI00036AB95E|nr:response regulator transcription factor [Algicola sagamiensis]